MTNNPDQPIFDDKQMVVDKKGQVVPQYYDRSAQAFHPNTGGQPMASSSSNPSNPFQPDLNDKMMLVDKKGRPIPQYYNPADGFFYPVTTDQSGGGGGGGGTSGVLTVNLRSPDANGNVNTDFKIIDAIAPDVPPTDYPGGATEFYTEYDPATYSRYIDDNPTMRSLEKGQICVRTFKEPGLVYQQIDNVRNGIFDAAYVRISEDGLTWGPLSGLMKINVIDNLTSTDEKSALSAKQGNVIRTWVNGVQNTLDAHIDEKASTTQLGHVKVDGTTITATDGVISAVGGGGGTPGPQGPPGEDGTEWYTFFGTSPSAFPTTEGKPGDLALDGITGVYYRKEPTGDVWSPQGSLKGPQGIQGPVGRLDMEVIDEGWLFDPVFVASGSYKVTKKTSRTQLPPEAYTGSTVELRVEFDTPNFSATKNYYLMAYDPNLTTDSSYPMFFGSEELDMRANLALQPITPDDWMPVAKEDLQPLNTAINQAQTKADMAYNLASIVDSGLISHAAQKASDLKDGHVQVDGTTITSNNGLISANLTPLQNKIDMVENEQHQTAGQLFYHETRMASASQYGHVRVDNTSITATNGIISATIPPGPIVVDDLNSDSSTEVLAASQGKALKTLYDSISGTVSTALSSISNHTQEINQLEFDLSVHEGTKASTTVLGHVRVDGSTIISTDGQISAVPAATINGDTRPMKMWAGTTTVQGGEGLWSINFTGANFTQVRSIQISLESAITAAADKPLGTYIVARSLTGCNGKAYKATSAGLLAAMQQVQAEDGTTIHVLVIGH